MDLWQIKIEKIHIEIALRNDAVEVAVLEQVTTDPTIIKRKFVVLSHVNYCTFGWNQVGSEYVRGA